MAAPQRMCLNMNTSIQTKLAEAQGSIYIPPVRQEPIVKLAGNKLPVWIVSSFMYISAHMKVDHRPAACKTLHSNNAGFFVGNC